MRASNERTLNRHSASVMCFESKVIVESIAFNESHPPAYRLHLSCPFREPYVSSIPTEVSHVACESVIIDDYSRLLSCLLLVWRINWDRTTKCSYVVLKLVVSYYHWTSVPWYINHWETFKGVIIVINIIALADPIIEEVVIDHRLCVAYRHFVLSKTCIQVSSSTWYHSTSIVCQ